MRGRRITWGDDLGWLSWRWCWWPFSVVLRWRWLGSPMTATVPLLRGVETPVCVFSPLPVCSFCPFFFLLPVCLSWSPYRYPYYFGPFSLNIVGLSLSVSLPIFCSLFLFFFLCFLLFYLASIFYFFLSSLVLLPSLSLPFSPSPKFFSPWFPFSFSSSYSSVRSSVFIGSWGEVHHTLYKHRAWWSRHRSSAFRHGGGHRSPVSPLMRVWVV